jgi:Multicopper oxidase
LGNSRQAPEVAETIPLVFRRKFAGNNWVDHWTINNKEFPKTDPILLEAKSRYQLRFDNQSDDHHPVHLHRHTFELTLFAGKPNQRESSKTWSWSHVVKQLRPVSWPTIPALPSFIAISNCTWISAL